MNHCLSQVVPITVSVLSAFSRHCSPVNVTVLGCLMLKGSQRFPLILLLQSSDVFNVSCAFDCIHDVIGSLAQKSECVQLPHVDCFLNNSPNLSTTTAYPTFEFGVLSLCANSHWLQPQRKVGREGAGHMTTRHASSSRAGPCGQPHPDGPARSTSRMPWKFPTLIFFRG